MIWTLALNLDFEDAKNIQVLQVPLWSIGRHCRFLTGVWHLDLGSDMVIGLWYTYGLNFGSLSWFWRCKEHPCPLSPHLGLWRMLEVPDWGFASWSWFGYGPWSLIHWWSKYWLYLGFDGSKIIYVLQVLIWGFAGGWSSCWQFVILILIWIWSLVFDTPMFPGSLSWFWGCKEPPCHLSPDMDLWRMLWVPDWGLSFWSWFGYGPCWWTNFWLYLGFEGAKNLHVI